MTNKVYNKFQKQPLWVPDNSVELDGIRLYAGDIALPIQWYENIHGIYGSYLVYIFYCDNTPQYKSHTQLVHANISTVKISGTAERHTSARYKIMSPPLSLHVNDLQWELNDRKEFYNKIYK